MNEYTTAAFLDELEKIGAGPLLGALGLDIGLAGLEGGVGAYKAIRHGKAGLATRLPYNPALAPAWAATKGLHAGSSRWAQAPGGAKKVIGRAGLATSKLMDASLQMDPLNAFGGMAHSGIDWLRARHKPTIGRVVPKQPVTG